MTRQKHQGRRPATTGGPRSRRERDAQGVQNLPNREAMSILIGLPGLPGLPPGIVDHATAAPDPGTVPADGSAAGPINQVSSTNVESPGTTEVTSATQDAPIVQP